MYISILGRQPSLGIAELEHLYGDVNWFGSSAATIETGHINITKLGGSQKIGEVVFEDSNLSWPKVSSKIVQQYYSNWKSSESKITLGISAYGFKDASARDVQKTGIVLKNRLKSAGVSLRIVPNQDPALSTATSHHNKLGLSDNKVELIVVSSSDGKVIIAESVGSQNITAYAARDQARPKRDAFVGMLPPKLAQIMLNLAVGRWNTEDSETPQSSHLDTSNKNIGARLSLSQATLDPESLPTPRLDKDPEGSPILSKDGRKADNLTVLDPFCGTGVILQEAALMGYSVYGTDLAEKMVRYSRENLNWLIDTRHLSFDWYLHEGDAMTTKWRQPINAVVAEGYLGQPFSAPPSASKLVEVRGNCDNIITKFLLNLAPQLQPDTPVCLAIPAWRDAYGQFTHLPLVSSFEKLGYKQFKFKNVQTNDLLYYREDQIVARQLLVLTKS